MILSGFWTSWRILWGKQPLGRGKAGRDLQGVVVWVFSLMLMERLEEGALLSLICLESGGEESCRGLSGFWVGMPKRWWPSAAGGGGRRCYSFSRFFFHHPDKEKQTPPVLGFIFGSSGGANQHLEWKSSLFFPWEVFTLWLFLTDCSSWNRPRSLSPQVRAKKYLIKRRFKLWEKFHMKNCHFHWVTQWLFRKISSLTRIDGQGYNCRVRFPPKLPYEVIINLWGFLAISEIT